jgi:hypothetical protein
MVVGDAFSSGHICVALSATELIALPRNAIRIECYYFGGLINSSSHFAYSFNTIFVMANILSSSDPAPLNFVEIC